MTRPIVVFDLDGTLVDTAPDLLESLNHCLECAGLQRAEPQELRRFVDRAGLALQSCETVTREKRPPHFEVVSLIAGKP